MHMHDHVKTCLVYETGYLLPVTELCSIPHSWIVGDKEFVYARDIRIMVMQA